MLHEKNEKSLIQNCDLKHPGKQTDKPANIQIYKSKHTNIQTDWPTYFKIFERLRSNTDICRTLIPNRMVKKYNIVIFGAKFHHFTVILSKNSIAWSAEFFPVDG